MTHHQIIAGVDEAGRGCLAGPVVAAAVIWPAKLTHPLLKDSKKLKETERTDMRRFVLANAQDYAIVAVDNLRIDAINILNATFEAMNAAILALCCRPDLLLIDGNRFRNKTTIPYRCEVKGDARFAAISAASILAKTERDLIMQRLHNFYPEYGWAQNMGYPTEFHRKALLELGYSPFHRRSFKLKSQQLGLDFFSLKQDTCNQSDL